VNPLVIRIAGEMAYSDYPHLVLKKWLYELNVSVGELARRLSVHPELIRNFVDGKRKNIGVKIKDIVRAVVDVAEFNGSISKYEEFVPDFVVKVANFDGMVVLDFLNKIGLEPVLGDVLDEMVFGLVVFDTYKLAVGYDIRALYSHFMTYTDKAIVFLHSDDYAPVLLKFMSVRPRVVVYHNLNAVFDVKGLHRRLGIPFAVAELEEEELMRRLEF